jgi:lantibiotic modifying enzyme
MSEPHIPPRVQAGQAWSHDDGPRVPARTLASDASGASSRLPATLLVQAARIIATGLRSACVEAGGDVGWVTEARGDGGADLYARADGRAWARDLALRAVARARRAATRADDPDDVPLGGLVGRGAQIYGLVTIGRLLDEPALLDEAHRLATRVEPGRIEADRSLDVVHGSAGLILALLSLGPAVAEPGPGQGRQTPLAYVRTASAHLLAMQRPPEAPWAGAVIGDSDALPQSGFAHGATGVSVALARAGEALGDRVLFAAAARALAFERDHCVVAAGRWCKAPGDPRTPTGWCCGAPGVALGRSAVVGATQGQIEDAPAARREIAEALVYMQQHPPVPLDHLCCGGMGLVDALLALSQADRSGALLAAAHARAAWILRAAKARGHFATGTEHPAEPSLFQGVAGVGYGFLRLLDPAVFPCLLMMTPAVAQDRRWQPVVATQAHHGESRP